ncbi:MAG: VWA domain-containing protein [Pirellulaceae bacterium]
MRFQVDIRFILLGALLVQACCVDASQADERSSAVGNALQGLFNPGAAADANTMGLLQRSNFIERVAGKEARIEIVLVVDATDSMSEQLQGIQQRLQDMLSDIRRVAGDEVYVQIVLYRDSAAPSGVVSWPLGNEGFVRDPQAIQTALAKLSPESGAPYFHEAVDQGVYMALNEVPWSKGEQVKRWIFLIGDAPPSIVALASLKTEPNGNTRRNN